mmetsp:Transcript_28197/g.76106  ORF Transcript_28197/g.76106 Transcript_28197/m.76106 type:complete len:278 (-) Transcript_28197:1072-1905(-)
MCILGQQQAEGLSLLIPGTASAANPVDVCVYVLGSLVVDDCLYSLDVQASSRHICCHEHMMLPATEAIQYSHACVLVHVSMDACGPHACCLQGRHEGVYLGSLGGKHDNVTFIHQYLQLCKQPAHFLSLILADDGLLAHIAVGNPLDAHRDVHWVGEGVSHQALDLAGHSGAEQQGLAVRANLAQDRPHLRLKAHLKHAVGFVQHQVRGAHQGACLHADEVNQPARSGHRNLTAIFEVLHLLVLGQPSKRSRDTHTVCPSKFARLLVDLFCQFTSGC